MKLLKRLFYFSKFNPGKIAVSLDTQISYSTLWQLAINLADYLKKRNINRICIFQAEEDDYISYVCMIASLISGKTYIPVNKNTPINRLKLIIKSSKADLLICKKKFFKFFFNTMYHQDILNLKKIKKFQIIKSSNNAYIIYTSGSTGKPKGVKISRKSLDHYILWISKSFFQNKQIRCSQHPGIGFDLSVADIFGTLCNGGTLFPIQNKYDNLFLSKFIQKNKISHWVSVPSAIDLIFNQTKTVKQEVSCLKKMFFCGEVLKKIHLEKIFKSNKKILVLNTYGPTEATVSCTVLRMNNKNYKNFCKPNASFGKPIMNMKIGFIEKKNNFGEIYLSGPQISEGYTNNSILNKLKFKKINRERSFITGDICKKIKGNYYFLNRLDRQVKILGNRVELDEIDSLIESNTKLTSFSIINQNNIYTFINGKFNEIEVTNNLKENLPNYMIPKKIIRVRQFPKNSNLKIDESKLSKLI
jgi:D-alanine--poly(phosphoribitol) ligase subunit 1